MNQSSGSLHVTSIGSGPATAVFLHGLLGQGKNLAGAAKALDGVATSLLIDAPNHGLSPWTGEFDYRAMGDAVAAELEHRGAARKPVVLIGHSMGGKTAMCLTLDHPELVEKLCVVDIAPVRYSHSKFFTGLISAMRGLDLAALGSRRQADQSLTQQIPDPVIRGFVLQNLHHGPSTPALGDRGPETWHWRANLALLARALPQMEAFPDFAGRHWDGPTLWVSGGKSDYVQPAYHAAMQALFPRVELVTVPGAAHWVHADEPAEFGQLLRNFVTHGE
ncbi:alpha/beta fold hydrolase [Propionibacterium freudenreichii]|uniref:alpha/beta fold hydrolase n=1 Tax=Propionibacterium freudenreichii TaxID=1744 RepID=UPI0021A70FFD|nr:alpha/beta fold hydrolase [Propionibacterium freudenreichii]MCT2976280.1 alpha/beta fold hydrolase [Propionibacterium freudenreichii]